MKLLPLVAVAQTRDDLSADESRFVHRRFSPGVFHLLDPIGKTATGAELHDDEAHGAKRPFRGLSIQKVDESYNIRVI